MLKKGTGLSRELRIRAKQVAVLEHYAEQAPLIGGNPEADRAAKILAVERGGYTRAQSNEAKLKQFDRLWKSDAAREHLREYWALAIPENADPVSIAFQTIHQHMVQDDESWGERERGVSLAAARQVIAMFVPNQTTKILSASVSARVERPAQYDQEPTMAARTILPAGTTIAAPTGPTGSDEEDDSDDDDAG